eukprot:UN11250
MYIINQNQQNNNNLHRNNLSKHRIQPSAAISVGSNLSFNRGNNNLQKQQFQPRQNKFQHTHFAPSVATSIGTSSVATSIGSSQYTDNYSQISQLSPNTSSSSQNVNLMPDT